MLGRAGWSAVLVVACAAGAAAQIQPPLPNVGPPLLLALDGVIEPSPESARGRGFTVTSLAFAGSDARRWVGVTGARTFGGDQPLDGKDVLAAVAPFTPNFLVTGPDDVVARIRDAAPGSSVRIEGLVDQGARTYYVRKVTVADGTASSLDGAREAGGECPRSSAAACTAAGSQEGPRTVISPSAPCSRSST